MSELLLKCLAAARLIVQAEKDLWPGCEDAVGVDLGGSKSSSDTKFQRVGTSDKKINYVLPQFLQDLITSNANTATNEPGLGSTQTSLLSSMMQKVVSGMPFYSTPATNAQLSPTSFTGASTLAAISARDPYSSQFETDTQDAYEQRASDAMAQVASGPDAVRGGNARTGIAQGVMADRLAQGRGEEVRRAQAQDAGIVGAAGQLFNQIENSRRAVALGSQDQLARQSLGLDENALGAARVLDNRKVSNLGSLQLASDMLGTRRGLTNDNLSGKGSQTNSSFNWSVPLSNVL